MSKTTDVLSKLSRDPRVAKARAKILAETPKSPEAKRLRDTFKITKSDLAKIESSVRSPRPTSVPKTRIEEPRLEPTAETRTQAVLPRLSRDPRVAKARAKILAETPESPEAKYLRDAYKITKPELAKLKSSVRSPRPTSVPGTEAEESLSELTIETGAADILSYLSRDPRVARARAKILVETPQSPEAKRLRDTYKVTEPDLAELEAKEAEITETQRTVLCFRLAGKAYPDNPKAAAAMADALGELGISDEATLEKIAKGWRAAGTPGGAKVEREEHPKPDSALTTGTVGALSKEEAESLDVEAYAARRRKMPDMQ